MLFVLASQSSPRRAHEGNFRAIRTGGKRGILHGLALPGASALATPLGNVPLDEEGARVAHGLRPVFVLPKAHDGEHSLELHLPFLEVVLDDFTVVPMVVGDPEPERVAEVLDAFPLHI